MRRLELLAPARNLACGKAAIDHGADAVYIGAPRFGARAAAGNSVEDIGELCRYAHQFDARVYVTVNTIIYDAELNDTFRLIAELRQAGVDALLVQDMALVQGVQEFRSLGVQTNDLGLPMHASTQTDNRTAEKVGWLHAQGFQRVVLARELSLEEIQEIHCKEPEVELEVFVHGALCVSYSGQCYMSQYCLGRSANRGECAQMCRMKYDLVDADGREIIHQRHLLSLKDLCRINDLEALADAGAVSFKIEGRLKDEAYVKNVVAAYSQRLDALCRKRPKDFCRASLGHVTYFFEPNLSKTFNRGFSDYFLHCKRDKNGRLQGRRRDIISPDTPKALGEYVGTVKTIFLGTQGIKESGHQPYIVVAGITAFSNGDGLCFFRESGTKGVSIDNQQSTELVGFRVNRAEGNRLYLLRMPDGLREGIALYRNNDVAFEKLLAGKTAERKIPVRMTLRTVPTGFELRISTNIDNQGREATTVLHSEERQKAQKPQRENIIRQLTKLGQTVYTCSEVVFENDADRYFIPSSQLAELRRQCVAALEKKQETVRKSTQAPHPRHFHCESPSYLLNIANRCAHDFYQQQGVSAPAPAFELHQPQKAMLMQCRHCLRFTFGICPFEEKRRVGDKAGRRVYRKSFFREPLYLRLSDGKQFRLEFDCRQCQMNILEE